MSRSTLKRFGIAVSCGRRPHDQHLAAGTIAPLLFGRITPPVAILFGPGSAATALIPALTGSGAFAAGLFVLPIEAMVIGAFTRRDRSPLLGGFILWTTVAATLIAVPSLYGVGYLRQTILPVALQVVVSGLVAVVVADLIATFAAKRLVEVDERPARHSAAMRFTGSCSPRRCRCSCWRRWTAS
jgi:hypothetical protein